jgi:hypothetical protein
MVFPTKAMPKIIKPANSSQDTNTQKLENIMQTKKIKSPFSKPRKKGFSTQGHEIFLNLIEEIFSENLDITPKKEKAVKAGPPIRVFKKLYC